MNSFCVTVSYGRVRGRARQYPYFEPCIYKTHLTKDGRLLWKLHSLGGTRARRSYGLAVEDAIKISHEKMVPYLSGIRQWVPVNNY